MGIQKDFLSLLDFSKEELSAMLDRAMEFRKLRASGNYPAPLSGQIWALMFEKDSLRTRVSFETGIRLLGGSSMFMMASEIKPGQRESLEDIGRVLAGYVNGIVLRTYSHEGQETIARYSTVPVINGLSDRSHPCQIMTDLQTIREKVGDIDGLKIAWVGDGNNMVYSWLEAAMRFNFEFSISCPKGYEPDEKLMDEAKKAGASVSFSYDPFEAVKDAAAINTDTWASMGQEDEKEERKKIFASYQLNSKLVAAADKNAVVLHCLPAYRDLEITDEVIEGPQSVVFHEAENRLYAQMAIMEFINKNI